MDKKSFLKILTFYDKVLIAVILLIAFGSYGIMYANARSSLDDSVIVKQNNEIIFQLNQAQLEKNGVYDFKFDGGIGQLQIKDKKVRLLPMDRSICPESVCSNTGWIGSSFKNIVCLPNQLVVSFTSTENNELDIIVR